MNCPHCGRDAPVIYRGALPTCTACGKIRPPLAGPAVHITGKPTRIGGTVTRFFGWLALAIGSTFALVLGAFFQWLWPAAIVGWALGIGVFAITLIVAFALLAGGSALKSSGARAEARTMEQAVFALAQSRGGILSPLDVAQVLGISDVEADGHLTELAKKNPERIRVEIDAAGTLVYQFPQFMIGTAPTQAVPTVQYEEVAAEAQNPAATRRSAR